MAGQYLLRAARALTLAAALSDSSFAFAFTPSSANYSLPSSAVNNGVANMAATNYRHPSSVGDTVYTLRSTSAGYALSPGFWHARIGVSQSCVLDLEGNNSISALTDGLLLLRAILGLTDTAVTNGAIDTCVARSTWRRFNRSYI